MFDFLFLPHSKQYRMKNVKYWQIHRIIHLGKDLRIQILTPKIPQTALCSWLLLTKQNLRYLQALVLFRWGTKSLSLLTLQYMNCQFIYFIYVFAVIIICSIFLPNQQAWEWRGQSTLDGPILSLTHSTVAMLLYSSRMLLTEGALSPRSPFVLKTLVKLSAIVLPLR